MDNCLKNSYIKIIKNITKVNMRGGINMGNMDPKYSSLFTPWKVRDVEIKNRIVLCPMGGTSLFGWMELTGNHFDKEAQSSFLKKQTTM